LNSRKIALVIVFTAMTAFLNLSPIKIPAPYAPFLIYQVWEIPIVTVSILYGFSLGLVVSCMNMLILLVIYPGALPTGPIYNLIAVVSMLLGIYVAKGLVNNFLHLKNETINVAVYTVIGTVMRVIVMTIVNWVVLPYPPPIGFSLPADVTIALLPVIALFNATISLYTVPLGVALAKGIKNRVPAI
jgi:riboflavin transporter FmnP